MTLNGKTITLDVGADQTTNAVKALIYEKEGIDPDMQVLTFGKWELQDGETLQSYGIDYMSIMHLTLRVVGGVRHLCDDRCRTRSARQGSVPSSYAAYASKKSNSKTGYRGVKFVPCRQGHCFQPIYKELSLGMYSSRADAVAQYAAAYEADHGGVPPDDRYSGMQQPQQQQQQLQHQQQQQQQQPEQQQQSTNNSTMQVIGVSIEQAIDLDFDQPQQQLWEQCRQERDQLRFKQQRERRELHLRQQQRVPRQSTNNSTMGVGGSTKEQAIDICESPPAQSAAGEDKRQRSAGRSSGRGGERRSVPKGVGLRERSGAEMEHRHLRRPSSEVKPGPLRKSSPTPTTLSLQCNYVMLLLPNGLNGFRRNIIC